MKTYYVIRRGWNAANQSSAEAKRNPRDTFESRLDELVAVVQADSPEAAVKQCHASVYHGQTFFAVHNPRLVKGLTREIRKFA